MQELILLNPHVGAGREMKITLLLSLSVSPLLICCKGCVTGWHYEWKEGHETGI